MPIRYAVFDVGQTLYPFSLQPLCCLMQENTTDKASFLNGRSPTKYDYRPYMTGMLSNTEFMQSLCAFCNVPYSERTAIAVNKALHQGCGKPFMETKLAIKTLRQHNVEICLLSNALPILADTGSGFCRPEYAFTSFELGLLKPDTAIFQAVQQKLNTPYEEILFIDDKPQNVNTAQTLGMHGIIFKQETIFTEVSKLLHSSQNNLQDFHQNNNSRSA
jgi:FMN phosphatase YigB (HAD superfamily)